MLEQAIGCLRDEGIVEGAPKGVRIRKRGLDPHMRERQAYRAEAA